MSNVKPSELTALAAASVAPASDVLPISDISAAQTKKITVEALGQALPAGSLKGAYAVDTAANDTYVITLSPVPSALVTGMIIVFTPQTGNTGACTLNPNGLGPKDIKIGAADPASGDIVAARAVMVVYNGTNFQLLNPAVS